jgi:glycosyltransferase involved in cell wall biosynthesis
MPDQPLVSIIIPVRNEERILGICLEAIGGLEYPKELVEVIVADSLSTDRSRQIAEAFGATVIPNPRQTVVSGRNCGVRASRGRFVAFTDADCLVRPDWLKAGLWAFQCERVGGAGGVTLFPDDATPFQKAVNVLFLMASFAGATAHRQTAPSARFVSDIPGCNCIYRRDALSQVMPLDENLLTAEDVWLNWQLTERGFRLAAVDGMILWHHRRSTPGSFCRQMYRFAVGRLQVGKRSRSLLSPLHIAAGFTIPLAIAAVALGFGFGETGILALAAVGACATFFGLGLARTRSFQAALYVPMVVGVFLGVWSAGFLRELFFPMQSVDGK